MSQQNHAELVNAQFGPRAAAYVASAVHASGKDLERLAEFAGRLRPTSRILDIGCGGGHVSFAVAPHVGQVVAYDMSVEMLNAVAHVAADRGLSNVVTRQGVAEKLPFPDGTFDAVVSRYSAHHWHDFRAGLREARRVLKQGGKAILIDSTAPVSPLCDTHFQAIELLRDTSHVRNYSETEWRSALTDAGFTVGTVTAWRVHLEFASWIARMRPVPLFVSAIRALQSAMPKEVADYLALEDDGSFAIDTTMFEAEAAP